MASAVNLITDRLPDSFAVCGRRMRIRTDFRIWIVIVELLSDEGIPEAVRLRCAAKILLGRPISELGFSDPGRAAVDFMREIGRFVYCGRKTDARRRFAKPSDGLPSDGLTPDGLSDNMNIPERAEGRMRDELLDFTYDSDLIAAAFRQVYGIDLFDRRAPVKMHFWQFMALLRSCPADTELMRTVAIRAADIGKIRDDEARRSMRRAKAAVRIR